MSSTLNAIRIEAIEPLADRIHRSVSLVEPDCTRPSAESVIDTLQSFWARLTTLHPTDRAKVEAVFNYELIILIQFCVVETTMLGVERRQR